MTLSHRRTLFFVLWAACAATFCDAQDLVITPPTKPISINAYALLNTTIYADTNVAQTTNAADPAASTASRGTQIVAAGQGLCCGSRLGLSGAAAFGSGLGGVFQLETGFLFNTGQLDQQQQIFGRQAYAGLTYKTGRIFNVLTVGRQDNVSFISTSAFDPYGHGSLALAGWDESLYGGRSDNSIQDVLTVGIGKVLFQYSPGGVPGANGVGTSLGGGVLYGVKSFIVGGTVSHSEDAMRHGLDVYGGGLRYMHGPVTLYTYGFDTRRDGGFTAGKTGSGDPLENASILANTNNPLRRDDRYVNFAARYDLEPGYAILGMYKFDKAVDVNAAHGHGTEATYMIEAARGVSKDFFLYSFVAFTKLTGAESTDPNSPNGSFAGASCRTYGGVGLNYRFNVNLIK